MTNPDAVEPTLGNGNLGNLLGGSKGTVLRGCIMVGWIIAGACGAIWIMIGWMLVVTGFGSLFGTISVTSSEGSFSTSFCTANINRKIILELDKNSIWTHGKCFVKVSKPLTFWPQLWTLSHFRAI